MKNLIKKKIKTYFIYPLAPFFISITIRLLLLSCRKTFKGLENLENLNQNNRGSIFIFWHCKIPVMKSLLDLNLVHKKKIYVLSSMHGDGILVAKTIQKFGLKSILGSSSKNGFRSLLIMKKKLMEGNSLVITPDGPKGPPQKIKDGVLQLSLNTKSPITPLKAKLSNYWQLKSWDKMQIPKPFSTIEFEIGRPLSFFFEEQNKSIKEEYIEEVNQVLNS